QSSLGRFHVWGAGLRALVAVAVHQQTARSLRHRLGSCISPERCLADEEPDLLQLADDGLLRALSQRQRAVDAASLVVRQAKTKRRLGSPYRRSRIRHVNFPYDAGYPGRSLPPKPATRATRPPLGNR